MKTKLELKHIAPYLPYGLKAQINTPYDQDTITEIIGLSENHAELIGVRKTVAEHFEFTDIKPILRPLSDFYDINAPAFIDTNFDLSTQLVLVDLCTKKQHYSSVKYSDIQEFLAYHIDIFNLIDQNLAININTLEL